MPIEVTYYLCEVCSEPHATIDEAHACEHSHLALKYAIGDQLVNGRIIITGRMERTPRNKGIRYKGWVYQFIWGGESRWATEQNLIKILNMYGVG